MNKRKNYLCLKKWAVKCFMSNEPLNIKCTALRSWHRISKNEIKDNHLQKFIIRSTL